MDKAAAEIQSQLGRVCAESGKSTSMKAKLRDTPRYDAHVAPSSVKKVVMQVEAGKLDNAVCLRPSGSGESDASGEGKLAGAASASMQQDGVDNVQELPSLHKVFSERVPVPIRYPAPSHVARQQTPWFFME